VRPEELVWVENEALMLRGTPLRHYRIEKELGRGASGIVYKATHSVLNRVDAIKVWLTMRSWDNRDKFEQGKLEAQMAAQASPEHAVRIYHADDINQIFYVTMEHIDGETLERTIAQKLDRPEDEWKRRIDLGQAYISAIRNTSRTVLHGDAHSRNVLIISKPPGPHGSLAAKLVDFGTSRLKENVTERFEARHWRIVHEQMDIILGDIPNYRAVKLKVAPFHQDNKIPEGCFKATLGGDFCHEVLFYCSRQIRG
jgi:serine/threonine protein kinase